MTEIKRTASWDRPYFTKPVEGNLHYYVVYGKSSGEFDLDGEDYRVYHMPEGISLSSNSVEEGAEPVNQFREGVFAQALQDQHPQLVDAINELDHCFIVQAILPDSQTMNDLKSIIGIVTYLGDDDATAILDPLTLTWWTPSDWREQAFAPEMLDPFPHVKILSSPEHNESEWLRTRGMRKFGRPDLSIHYVTEEEREAVEDMLNRFIGFMAAGGEITEGQEVKMKTLPAGMLCHHMGSMENPDFNNIHIEITWPDPDAQ